MAKQKIVDYYHERYKGSLTDEQCDCLEQLIEVNDSNGCIPDLRHIIYDVNKAEVQDYIDDIDRFGVSMHDFHKTFGTLRDEQTIGVAYMYWSTHCIIGDSVGLGKTVETAGVCNLLNAVASKNGGRARCLVLTLKNVAAQFRFEMVQFTGRYSILIQSSEQDVVQNFVDRYPYFGKLEYDVVGTHNLLSNPYFIQWLELCRTDGDGFPFDILVIDESSVLGGKARTLIEGYKAIEKYFKRVYFLNATPFETSLEIFYNQLNLLDPKMLPTKENFVKQYCVMDYRGMYPKPSGKYKNQEHFKRLVGYRYFARTRRDKGAVMEDCDGKVVLSELSPVQKNLLSRTQLTRMVFDCPNYIDDSIEFNIENVPKLASLLSLLKNECADADTIILFSMFKESQYSLSEWLSKQGYSNRILNGDTDNKERQFIIDGFKNSEFRVLITNVQRGLNFGNCNYCIFYSFDPNPAKMLQFEGRITRDFDIIGKNVYILCSLGREYRTLNDVVRERAKATKDFTNTDFSVVMEILLGGRRSVVAEED